MVIQHVPRGVTKELESIRRMSRWWIRLWLIASHVKPFQDLAQTIFRCCWDMEIKMERVHNRRRPNYPKEDWPLFHKCLDRSIHTVLSIGSQSKLVGAFPIKAVRKGKIHWRMPNWNSLFIDAKSCAGISEQIANNGWRRTARSPESQKNPSGQTDIDT